MTLTHISDSDRLNGYIRLCFKDAPPCSKCGGTPEFNTTNERYYCKLVRLRCTKCGNATINYDMFTHSRIENMYYLVNCLFDYWHKINKETEQPFRLETHLL